MPHFGYGDADGFSRVGLRPVLCGNRECGWADGDLGVSEYCNVTGLESHYCGAKRVGGATTTKQQCASAH